MSNFITTAFVQQYATNVAMLLQQEGSRLRGCVQEYALYGQAAEVLEQFGQVSAVMNQARGSDTPLVNTPQNRRWCYPNDFDVADLIDNQDKLRLLIDPTGPYAKAQAYALGRAIDDQICAAFFSNSNTGQNGSTSTAFPSGQQVAIATGASASTGLNVAKLRAARQLFLAAEVSLDTEQFFVALDAKAHNDMLNEAQAVNLDYNTRPVLVDGRITSFMGFNFVHSERYPGAPSYQGTAPSNRQIPAWVKSGMALGIWNDISASVDRRPDKRNSWQVYTTGTFGATRLEEQRVVMINAL